MNKEKDQLFEQTEAQRNPYLARPEDFEIMSAADAARRSLPGQGQSGDNLCQYLSLVKTSCTWRMNDCRDSGLGGSDLSFWSHPEPSLAGIGLAFGCTGNGFQELGGGEGESL
jgi:hypothetical protein